MQHTFVIHKAKVKNDTFIGMTEGPFKSSKQDSIIPTHFGKKQKKRKKIIPLYLDEGLGSNSSIERNILILYIHTNLVTVPAICVLEKKLEKTILYHLKYLQ